MADYSVYNEFVAVLYLILGSTTLVRLGKKLRETSCSVPKKSRQSFMVLVTLIVYAFARSGELFMIGVGEVPSSGNLESHFYTTIPAAFFLTLQTAFIWKWVSHVSELTLALQSNRFRLGSVALVVSIFLFIFVVGITLVAVGVTSQQQRHSSSSSSSSSTNTPATTHSPNGELSNSHWNDIITFCCGLSYFANGFMFISLGLLLRSLWAPNSPDGIRASYRILGIALLFGTMCCARGIALCLYTMDMLDGHMRHVTHAGWAAPTVLLVEWIGICFTLFLLTRQKSSNNNNVIGSNAGGEEDHNLLRGSNGSDDSMESGYGGHGVGAYGSLTTASTFGGGNGVSGRSFVGVTNSSVAGVNSNNNSYNAHHLRTGNSNNRLVNPNSATFPHPSRYRSGSTHAVPGNTPSPLLPPRHQHLVQQQHQPTSSQAYHPNARNGNQQQRRNSAAVAMAQHHHHQNQQQHNNDKLNASDAIIAVGGGGGSGQSVVTTTTSPTTTIAAAAGGGASYAEQYHSVANDTIE